MSQVECKKTVIINASMITKYFSPSNLHHSVTLPVVYPGFPTGGGTNHKDGYPTYYFAQNFQKKRMKKLDPFHWIPFTSRWIHMVTFPGIIFLKGMIFTASQLHHIRAVRLLLFQGFVLV